ncbi:hypothetical protein GCM10027423_22890 [Spirosoma arcticum]
MACLLTGLAAVSVAQTTTLTGHVTDAATNKAMPFANVYLNGSTRGTLTNEQGYYALSSVPLGTVEIVASFVGYQPQRRTLRLDNTQNERADFRLKPDDQTLAAVTVRGNLKLWQRHVKQFKKQLLGEPFGGQCQLVNSDVLNFNEKNGHLTATATEPLVIENQALGYRLYYDMRYFDGTYQKVYYAGTTRFEELKAADERQANRYQRNRMRAYNGSTRHLMASLIDSTYQQQGFLAYQEDITVPIAQSRENRTTLYGSIATNDSVRGRLKPLQIKKLIQPGRLPFERRLVSNRQLVVFYTPAMSAYSPYADARFAYTQIRLPAGQIQLTVDGVITLPEGMELQGSLADDRLSTLLPDDWKPNPVAADSTTSAPFITQGKLMPADARLGRIATTFNERFKALAPVLFVHTDKPFYATGDRLWLSAYLLDAATNRPLSGETAIHVDVVAPTGTLVQHQWLRVADGRAVGNFRLSDSLASGTYRLRAYTDEDDGQRRPAFERAITVYNLLTNTTVGTADIIRKRADVQILPEGGRWLVGVPSRLGIKVVGPDGRGLLATGRIVDNTGTEICRVTTSNRGMGSVVVTPLTGRTYYAEVIHNSQQQVVPLPPAELQGFSLSVDAVTDSTRFVLTITGTHRSAADSVYVLIQQQGRLVDQRKIQLQNGTARLSLPTTTLPPGLNQITLFDDGARPQAERLVFVPERVPPIRVVLNLNKDHYQPREPATLSVALNDDGLPAVAVLSASITDAEQVPDDSAAATVRTHLLLTGELRGRVEQPNEYLKNNAPETRRALDDLLLTQGWRRVSGTPATNLLGGVSLMGRVLNANNQPVAGAQVVVASTTSKPSFVRSAGADERGRFRLAGLAIADTVKLMVQLADRQLKDLPAKEAHLVLDGPGLSWEPDTVRAMPDWGATRAQLAAARTRQDGEADLYRDKTAKLLKEVTVRARKYEERPQDIQRRSLHGAADATIVFDANAGQFANLYEMIRGRLAGVNVTQTPVGYRVLIRGVSSVNGSTEPLFLLDGVAIQGEAETMLLTFNPGDIERVELLKNAGSAATYGVRGGSGVIAFYTKSWRSGSATNKPKTGMTPLQLIGYPSVQREFYVPRYERNAEPTQSAESSRVDRRDVLYWKPLMQTDGQGRSQLMIPLSDVVRTVRVLVQGITADGRPVVGEGLFRVQ